MSQDTQLDYEQVKHNYEHCESNLLSRPSSSAFVFTPKTIDCYSEQTASCSKSIKYNLSNISDDEEEEEEKKRERGEKERRREEEEVGGEEEEEEDDDDDEEEEIYNMGMGQEENEIDLDSSLRSITTSCFNSFRSYVSDSSDDDEQTNDVQYTVGTSEDEEELIDNMQMDQTTNEMVLNNQFEPIASCSKSMIYCSPETSDEDDKSNIPHIHEKKPIIIASKEKFVKSDLPVGWKIIIHDSGVPIYLHEDMKVCSFSKPYYLGSQSLKNHSIPVVNVPCLDYKLKLENMNSQTINGELQCPKEKLNPEEYKNYCRAIFRFKNIKFMRFSSWDKRREYIRMIKADRRRRDLPKFKDRTQLIAVPAQPPLPVEEKKTPTDPDDWIINLNNKSYVSILHEYIQRVLKTQPSYVFKELENARYPYLATVILDGMQYGIGIGSSKKQAKLDSARATLEILLPTVKDHIQINRKQGINENYQVGNVFDGNIIFDQLKIKDSRIPEFCAQAAESMPYDMLQICVKRNFGENVKVKSDMQTMQSTSESDIFYRLTMKVKKHSATVICKNKREGRQKGAQALLKVLHPHIKYFGSLLRLYSHQNMGTNSEKKLEEIGSLSPQCKGGANQIILDQLKEEMAKIEN